MPGTVLQHPNLPTTSPRPFHTQLLDAVGQAIIATDLCGKITYWNPAAEALYGWTSDEVVGRNISEVTPTEATTQQAEEILASLTQGESWTGEFHVQRRDGTEFPALVTDTPIFNDAGELAGIIGISIDNTAQKEALLHLESERNRLETMFEHAPAFMCLLQGPDHVYAMANPAYIELVEYRDIIGKPVVEALPELEGQVFADVLDEVFRTGEPFVGTEVPFMLKLAGMSQPETRYLNFVYQPLVDTRGNRTGIFVHGVDVTEQVAAREIIHRKSNFNQMVMDRSPDVICTIDEDGRFVQVSAASERIWGYPAHELVGRHCLEFVVEEDGNDTGQANARLMEGNEILNFENRWLGRDGAVVDMLWSASWSKQERLGFSVGRDVTQEYEKERQLKASHEALRVSELRLRSLVEASSQVVWTADAEGNVLELSDTWEALTGQVVERRPSWQWATSIHPDDHDRVIEKWREHLALKIHHEDDFRVRTRDGSYCWVNVQKVPVVDKHGAFIEWIGTCTNIHDKVLAAAALRESEARYRTIVDTAHEGVLIADPDGKTTFVNERMGEILGRSVEVVIGRPISDFVFEEDSERFAARFERRKEGISETYDVRCVRPDGSLVWLMVSASPFYDEHSGFTGSIGMATDITDRKVAEVVLREAKEKAEDMSRLKSAFLTNMSHEIRTPLTSVIGLADILADEVSGEARELAEMIQDGGERLLLMLNSVMDLAQLEGKSLRISPSAIDVVKQVRDLLPMFERTTNDRGLYLQLETEVPHLNANLDEGALTRIMNNLIGNGLKFTEQGGVKVLIARDGDHVRIEVVDSGIGMSEDFQMRMFDDFEQESEGLSRAYEGVGLGLPINATRRIDGWEYPG
ncbi:hypothetical protein BH23BAC4_BH23BAC4_09050 [soil metagenome]